MLKRQRPASPIPAPWDGVEEEKNLPEDLYEPMSKRRRYFTSSSPSFASQETFTEHQHEQDDISSSNAASSSWHPEHGSRKGIREWQKDAGEYKSANTLLHDLHAEQQHRIIFSTSATTPSTTHSDTEARHRSAVQHQPTDGTHSRGRAPSPSPRGSISPDRKPSPGAVEEEYEAQVVSQRYEETNRYVQISVILEKQADVVADSCVRSS